MALGALLACALLASFASVALASNYDMRGEWSVQMSATHGTTFGGQDIINRMEEPSGNYSGSGSFVNGQLPATMSGTVLEDETSISVVANTPSGVVTFIATKMAINTTTNEFEGPGTYYNSKNEPYETGHVKLVRLKTYQQVIEQQEREHREAEERAARTNVQGEWELTLKVGSETYKAIALISSEANSKNEFSSSSMQFVGGPTGSFTGTLEGEKATVKIVSEAVPSHPRGEFTSSAISVSSKGDPASMSGSGKFVVPEFNFETTGELTATKIHTYGEVKAREAEEREAKEQQEKEAQEAVERAKAAAEKLAREEREARERAMHNTAPTPPPIVTIPAPGTPLALLAASPSGTSFGADRLGVVALRLSNPNSAPIHGRVSVTFSGSGSTSRGHRHAKAEHLTLGSATFTLTAHADETLSVKLSHSGLALLRKDGKLHVAITVTTEASGAVGVAGKYSATLSEHKPRR